MTDADRDYVGSVTIDEDLIDAVGLWAFEKVMVVSLTSGERLETYVIPGERGSGKVCMNGAAAHKIKKGHVVIIMGFEFADSPGRPKVAIIGEGNRLERMLEL